jgi:hypothetical protein
MNPEEPLMRRIVLALLPVLPLLSPTACTSREHEVYDIDEPLDVKGHVDKGEVGIDKDGEAVVREEQEAADELRLQRSANAYMRERLEVDHHELQRCVRDLADPRLGGRGDWTKLPDLDDLESPAAKKERLGLSSVDGEEHLKVVKTSYLRDEIDAERKYERAIKAMKKQVAEQLDRCDYEMAQARLKAGLPADRFKAEGYFLGDGTWVETRKAEQTVSDAFEIQAQLNAKAGRTGMRARETQRDDAADL